MTTILDAIAAALTASFSMFWAVLWPLALGFLLSALVETFVSKKAIVNALGRDTFQAGAVATGMGAASSSCSYAATAVARTLFRRGATLRNAIIFEFASTNLVFELGLVLLVLLGWRFLLGELSGGLVMIVLLAILFRATFHEGLARAARDQADKGLEGRMEGHGAMDMSVTEGPFLSRLFSNRAFTAISHYYFMSVASLWLDLVIGFLVAGALSAWVPASWWSNLFLLHHGLFTDIWDAVIGPIISVVSFVCSVGNIPLAAVLWRSGISFSGAIAFIFADLIIIPILSIYRRYYTVRVASYLTFVSYTAMVLAGLAVGVAFGAFGVTPTDRHVSPLSARPSWNYESFLDVALLGITLILGLRFVRTGGPAMLRMMEHAASGDSAHHH